MTRAFASMQSRYKAIIIAIGVALVLAAYFSGEEEVSLSEAAWDCALADSQQVACGLTSASVLTWGPKSVF